MTAAIGGCGQPTPSRPNLAVRVAEQCEPRSSDTYYFPAGTFSTAAGPDRATRAAASSLLRAAQERSLSCEEEIPETYRCVRTVAEPPDGAALRKPRPVVVRVGRGSTGAVFLDQTWHAVAVRHGAVEEAFPDRREVAMSDRQVAQVLNALKSANFWGLETAMPARDENTDGDVWILEGRKGTNYHAVQRRGVSLEPVPTICAAMQELTGVSPDQPDS